MAGVFLAGARLSVKRLNAHALHQRANVLVSNIEPLPIELVAQHTCIHEWVFQVQCVNAAHCRGHFCTDSLYFYSLSNYQNRYVGLSMDYRHCNTSKKH